jgi:hypothetical protein
MKGGCFASLAMTTAFDYWNGGGLKPAALITKLIVVIASEAKQPQKYSVIQNERCHCERSEATGLHQLSAVIFLSSNSPLI